MANSEFMQPNEINKAIAMLVENGFPFECRIIHNNKRNPLSGYFISADDLVEKLIPNGNETVNFITNHYGVAGRKFIEHIKAKPLEQLQEKFSTCFNMLMQLTDTTDKQALAMALLFVADGYADECIFHSKEMDIKQVAAMLKTNAQVDVAERAYRTIIDTIAENGDKFDINRDGRKVFTSYWGRHFTYDNTVKIIKTVLDRLLKEKCSTSFDTVKQKWADKGYLLRGTGNKNAFILAVD